MTKSVHAHAEPVAASILTRAALLCSALLAPPAQIAETYAFLPREAVTRFLMSCGECQKRMHINPSTAEFKGNASHAQPDPQDGPLIRDFNRYVAHLKLTFMRGQG